jgi:hypothetical protein
VILTWREETRASPTLAAKLTKEGRRTLAAFSPGDARTKNFKVQLKAKKVLMSILDLRKFFVFDSPGNYTIRFIYEELSGRRMARKAHK